MKYNPGNETLANHFLKFDKLIRELKQTGATLEETDVVCHLFLTMPPEMDTVVTALETLSKEDLTIAFVKNRLMDEETKKRGQGKNVHNEEAPSTAFAAGKKNTAWQRLGDKHAGKSKYSGTNFPYRCHGCGKIGHKRADCRNLKKNDSTNANLANDEKESDNFSFMATTADQEGTKTKFFLDSGASDHLVREDEELLNVRKLEKSITIKVAKSGASLKATYTGDLEVLSRVGSKDVKIVINNVLLVPELSHNLLSIRRLEDAGFEIEFKKGAGSIRKNGKTAAVAVRGTSELYVLDFKRNWVIANLCEKETSLKLWHKRMGHLNYDSVKRLPEVADGISLDGTTIPEEICEICVEGKQAKLPHNQQRHRATRPLQLVHTDLFGPITPTSHDGKRYLLTFTDDFTPFAVAYPLGAKSETFKYLKIFERMATAHFNCRMSRLRCDNGREYTTNET